MAPEQLAGQGTSTRTDVYALGLVLYELFTGKPAFDAQSTPTVSAAPARSTGADAAVDARPDIDPAVERVILRCLEKDPARRPASAARSRGRAARRRSAGRRARGRRNAVARDGRRGGRSRLALAGAWAACLAVMLLGVAGSRGVIARHVAPGPDDDRQGSDVLAEQARPIVRSLGYTDSPADEAYGYVRDDDYLRYLEEHDRTRRAGAC